MDHDHGKPADELRRRAEERLSARASSASRQPRSGPRLIHELQVHQIELEMQNEELLEARARAEALLAQYTDLYDFAPTGYLTLDRKGTVRRVNLTGARLFGVARSRLVTRRLALFVAESDRRAVSDFLERAFAGEANEACEVTLPREGTAPLVVRIEGRRSEDGQECRAMVLDITARQRTESYREMDLAILQSLNLPGTTHDAVQRVLAILKTRTGLDAVGIRLQDGDDFPYIGQQGFSMDFLLTENTLVERGADGEVCRDEDGSICLECACGLVISGKTDPSHPLFTRGGSFWTNDSTALLGLPPDQDPRSHPRNRCVHLGYSSVALVPIRDKGRIVGLIHLNDRRRGCFTVEAVGLLEGTAEHIGTALTRRQAEAERAILESQLHQAQKMEAVGRLAGGVAHDFNNLLMGIMNYVELCRDGLPPEHPVRRYLDEIRADAWRSADITKQLLTFARKQAIAPKVLNLNDALGGMLKMLRHLMGEDTGLAWLPGMDLWPIRIDPGQLDQILANLCVNARDAIAGVGEVAIETANVILDEAYCSEHPEAAPGEYVRLTVSDSGCGMGKDVLAHVFEPFYTTKDVGKGTGLGLATVFGIVEQSHGHIAVRSELGKGTTFSIYLPRETSDADTGPAPVAPEELPHGTETILLAEDEKSVRVTSHLFLEALGYTVLAAETPEAALRLGGAHSGVIHLLIADVIMPGMNGPDLAALLAGTHPTLKCLFMSGYTADVMLHRGTLAAGMSLLAKPFSRYDLARKVRDVLDGR